jgi:PAS domain S-box-containing protein
LLVAKAKNVLFDAELPRQTEGPPPTPVPNLKNGSRVRLTGISVVRLQGERDRPTHFRLLLRGPEDIVLLQQPPWWTLGRLVWLLVALASVAAVAVVWGVALRRRVRSQTGIIRQQIQTENTLEARYRELFDNANDVVYTHDTEGRLLTINRAGEAVTGYTRDELLGKTILELALPARREMASEWLKKLAGGDVPRPTFETELIAKDGRLVPLEISVRPLMEGGVVRAVEGIARDITERKRAEAELGAAQQRLVETSRRAGMAEVASGVLHNVGNVLSSVTASTAHLSEQLRASNGWQLPSVLETLREHAGDLPDFLATDPRGRELPAQLVVLAEQLTAEHAVVAREVEALGRSVDHIKEIVAVQQGYARVSGVRAEVSAEVLIEDALRINREALERHRITVVRDFAPAPPLLIEKHKVLEILVNLLSNAKYACDERAGGGLGARITVRIDTPKGERAGGRVRLVVADNGIGIPHQHLSRIFDNGFSTREGGNGIGLHSAWTTARELGGSLFVHSDGIGKGARFTLDLPVRPPEGTPNPGRRTPH